MGRDLGKLLGNDSDQGSDQGLAPNEHVVNLPPVTATPAPQIKVEADQPQGNGEEAQQPPVGRSNLILDSANDDIKKQEDQDQSDRAESALAGAGAGAVAAHTDAARRLGSWAGSKLKAAPGVWSGTPKGTSVPTGGMPEGNVSVEPFDYDSEVEKIMQSERGKGSPTGRQMESGHNWETNRQAMAGKENLGRPGAPQAVVEAGPMAPTKGGIAVPAHRAREIEEEELRRKAQAEVARRQQEAEAKLAREEAARVAQEDAAKAAKVAGIKSGLTKVGAGALGGFFAGKDFYDMYNEMKQNGWSDEAISKAISGTGGLAMTIPTPATEIGGLALQGIGAAYPYVAPYVRKAFK